MPDWSKRVVWWQVYPLGFLGIEPPIPGESRRRLDDIVGWLDYACELGASGLALGPIFASSTHGYDTVDHFRIDDRLGGEEHFDALVAAVHARGMRLLLDGVFNHVGRHFPAFERTLAAGPSAPESSWFVPLEGGVCGPAFKTFEGHEGLIALNHDEPEVARYVIDVMRHWLARGADGWRLDAAYTVPSRFWRQVLPAVRTSYPDAYFVGEVIHGDYRRIVEGGGMDACTQYELWKATWSCLNDRNFFELAWALRRHNEFLHEFLPMTFVGNHDVTRLASRLNDERHIGHALAILLTAGGTPSVYYGDEQAFRGVKEARAGGDDAVRPAFPAEGPNGLEPYGWPVYRLHQQLIGVRRQHPWLPAASNRTLHLSNTALIYEATAGPHRLVTALNTADHGIAMPVPRATTVVAGAADLECPATAETRLSLPPHGWAIVA